MKEFDLPISLDPAVVKAVGETFILDVVGLKTHETLVLVEKQFSYGPHNIGRPPSGVSPETAVLVRLNDKLQRLGTLLSSGTAQPPGSESRLDSWGDLSNYGTIGTMLELGLWPGLRKEDSA